MILGLTGSLGSGKSTVSGMMSALGAVVVCADAIAHEVTSPGTPAHDEIVAHFGPGVLAPSGKIDRRLLAERVFAQPEERKLLERIVHPRVRQRELDLISEHGTAPLIVLDIPLLFETGGESLCDRVAVVTVSEQVRRERLKALRGMSDQEIDARLSAQMLQEEKVRRADYLIDNSGSLEATREQVARLHAALVAQAQP